MEVVTGAMGSLLPKLGKLLMEEYKLQKGVKKDIESLESEIRSMRAALSKVAEVPRDQLDPLVKIWADEVRELSYDMEDVVDNFLVCVEESDPVANSQKLKWLMGKMANLFTKGKTRHQTADAIQDIKSRAQKVADRRDRYKIDDVFANAASINNDVDPRLFALYKNQKDLIGIEGPQDGLIKRLTDDDGDVSKQQLKVVSIFGFGGLGKTTLAKTVYDKLQAQYKYKAFVPVGQKPQVKEVLKVILLELGDPCMVDVAILDERLLINKIRQKLQNESYFIVIDDIWDLEVWKIIRCALLDNDCGSRVITTTRILDIAKNTGDVYEHKPLSDEFSKELFYTRLFGGKDKCPYDHPIEVSKNILHKCGGVPLAIITIASLLVGKPLEDWSKVYTSIGFGHGDNTRKILSFSYYDLPCYLKPCLLHLSIFPEDSLIMKDTLIWKWAAEGFFAKEPEVGLFEIGERYFNELINRSMILPVENDENYTIYACRVHDMVLDMICLLSNEQNFVTILDSHGKYSSSERNARRLAIQRRYDHTPLSSMSIPNLRSYYANLCNPSMMPSFSSLEMLRVLDLEGCKSVRECDLKHLKGLLLLRYLSLEKIPISWLPAEIGDLKCLQTLDLKGTELRELPESIGLLRKLKRLCVEGPYVCVGVPNWIGNLTSLEELHLQAIGEPSIFVKELGKLTELRVLICRLQTDLDECLKKTLVESLCNLRKIHVLQLPWSRLEIDDTYWECYEPPQQLRDLAILNPIFTRLPAWINSSFLKQLYNLDVKVDRLEEQDVVNLGRFPELLHLNEWLRFPAGMEFADGAFPKLRSCLISAPFRFLQGSMQNLESITIIGVKLSHWTDVNTDFDFLGSLRNLPSLRRVDVLVKLSLTQTPTSIVISVLARLLKTHPNRPTLNQLSPNRILLHPKIINDEEEGEEIYSEQTKQESHHKDDNRVREGADQPDDQSKAADHLNVGTSARSPACTSTTAVGRSAQAINDNDKEEESQEADRQEQPADESEPESRSIVDVSSLAESGETAGTQVPARRTWRQWACFACLDSGTSSSAPPTSN